MGSIRLTLCAGALAFTALTPSAYAADGGGILVTPTSPGPGSDIALHVPGCGEKTGIAVSAAFVADVRLSTGPDGTLVGESRVRSSLTAGTYDVKVKCGDTEHKAAITVGDARTRPAGPATPVAPVHAGGGGTASRLAAEDTRSAGPGTGQTVTGLVLAGGAAVAVALRGARRSRRAG